MFCSVFTILAILNNVVIKLELGIICLDKTNLIDYSVFTQMNNGLMEIIGMVLGMLNLFNSTLLD